MAHVACRLIIAVLGGYFFSASIVALMAAALSEIQVLDRSESVVLASMLGFPIYLSLLIWAFAEKRIVRVGLTMTLGIAVCSLGVRGIHSLTAGS